ncbi:MAG: hypothetical protein ABW250_16370 [Pyrinomonadaceae bacterium]
MRRRAVCSLLLIAGLCCAAPGAAARQESGSRQTEAEVRQLRDEIARLEQIASPAGQEARHRGIIDDKRIRLHALLQKQRDELTAYRAQVQSLAPASDLRGIEQDIEVKRAEMEAIKSLLRAAPAVPVDSSARTADPAPQPDEPSVRADGERPRSVRPDTPGRSADATPRRGVSSGGGRSPQTDAGDEGDGEPAGGGAITMPEGIGTARAVSDAASNDETARRCSATSLSPYESAICDLADEVAEQKATRPGATVSLTAGLDEFLSLLTAKLIGREERAKFLLEAEETRTDKQVGAGPSASGSTSLVVKGSAPAALGFAVENGALLRGVSGTTVTFRGNPLGLAGLLSGKGYDDLTRDDDPFTRLLGKTSFSFSFDTSRGREPGVFTADAQQLSAYSARIEFVNERDPRHPKHQEAWERFFAKEGIDFTRTIASTYRTLRELRGFTGEERAAGIPREVRFKDAALQAWYEETRQRVAEAEAGSVEAVIRSQLEKIPAANLLSAETRAALGNFAGGFSAYLNARESVLDEIAKAPIIAFEYTNNREVNAPDTSNFRFIAEKGVFGGKGDLTANASLTIFNSRPAAGTERVRDFQFAGQFDVPFRLRDLPGFVFSFAGKYERVMADATALDGTVLPGTRGDIAVGQLKLEIPFLPGMRLPLSLTFANRTELVRESEVRGNFGFTFDMDKILARFKPF